jgi:nitroreductase
MSIETPAVHSPPTPFENLVRSRFSLRAYTDQPVAPETIRRCVESARLAPSACNSQPWHFIVVTDAQRRKALARLTVPPGGVMNAFAAQAPVIVAIVAERPNITSQIGSVLKNKPFYLIDVGITAEHFCLQAAELGLGTCMIGWFQEKETRKLLGIPRGRRPVLLITVGYPPEGRLEPPPRKRKDLEAIMSIEQYGAPADH